MGNLKRHTELQKDIVKRRAAFYNLIRDLSHGMRYPLSDEKIVLWVDVTMRLLPNMDSETLQIIVRGVLINNTSFQWDESIGVRNLTKLYPIALRKRIAKDPTNERLKAELSKVQSEQGLQQYPRLDEH